MRKINIPQLAFSDPQRRRERRGLVTSIFLTILCYFLLLMGLQHSNFFAPPKILTTQELLTLQELHEPPLQFVTVDRDLLDDPESPRDAAAQGRVSREARASTIEKNDEKSAPANQDDALTDAFKIGEISLTDHASPAGNPTPQPPVETSEPMESRESQRVSPEVPPPIRSENSPPKKSAEKELDNKSLAQIDRQNNRPDLSEFTQNSAPELALPQPPSGKTAERPPLSPIAKTAPAEITEKSTSDSPAENNSTNAAAPQPEIIQQAPRENRRPAPSRQIGGNAAEANGGRMRRRDGGAVAIGIQSIAVLKSKYGDYMDELLRRIQAAILIQQQLSPMMFTQGAVVMTFSINADGQLENIRHLASEPPTLISELGAARRVLDDVKNGNPLPPPTAAMLADPLFKKIVINFLFEPR